MKLETGTISFCGRKALNIKSDEYKRRVLTSIEERHGVYFNRRNYQSYKPNHRGMVEKSGGKSMLSVVSGGNTYLLYITKDEYSGKNQVFFIDCKVCDGYEYPRIIMLWLRFREEVYKNTLFRGELVRDRDSKWIFIIDDLLAYCGNNMNKTKKYERVSKTHEILGGKYRRDDNLELMTLRIKRYFTGANAEEMIKSFIPSLNYDSKGIMMHLTNGMNLYINTSGERGRKRRTNTKRERPKRVNTKVDKRVNLSAAKTDYKTERHIAPTIKMTVEPVDSPKISADKTVRLLICATEQPDVYKLYAKKGDTNRRVSYAHVPSIEISKMLRETFEHTDDDVIVECKYNVSFEKWTPLRITVGTVDTVSTVKSIKRSATT